MAVMPNTPDTALLDKLFADMRTLFERARAEAIPGIEMKELSMGMSHDYELAARHGATMVRIGSALMGARDYGPQGATLMAAVLIRRNMPEAGGAERSSMAIFDKAKEKFQGFMQGGEQANRNRRSNGGTSGYRPVRNQNTPPAAAGSSGGRVRRRRDAGHHVRRECRL